MPARQQASTLSVRIPTRTLREVKARAATQGKSLQAVVDQALQAWLRRSHDDHWRRLLALEGSLAGTDALEYLEQERQRDRDREAQKFDRLAHKG